ncbi:MAG: glycosyltransferase family 2 protein [Flavisolibacter sp.]|jgi:GT2 family glycosyltransferase
MQQGISVVIPNFNGIMLLPEILPAVYKALENIALDYEIIVADDCSTDGSVNFLKEKFPTVNVLVNEKNSGFSISANKGIRTAKHDLVLLLNSDVKLESDYFTHLLPYFDNPEIFGVMGRIVGWDDDNLQDGAKYPSFHHAKIKTSGNYILENKSEMCGGLLTIYLSGANALFDRKKFLQLDGFNEIFSPFYVEDYELSLRAWRMGYRCMYEYRAVCRHKVSTTITTGNRKSFIRMIYNRNKWFLHAIHLGRVRRITWMIQLIPEIFFQSLMMKGYYMKAFLLFIKAHKHIRRSRRNFEKQAGERIRSVDDVVKTILASVKDKKLIFFR